LLSIHDGVFLKEDKIIIKIWKDHSLKNWTYSSVKRLLKRFKGYGATKPFFVNGNGIKVNKENYYQHLKNCNFLAIKKHVKRDDWIFVQDGATSHQSNLVQDFLEQTLKHCFVKRVEWPPSSPDTNPLDYFF